MDAVNSALAEVTIQTIRRPAMCMQITCRTSLGSEYKNILLGPRKGWGIRSVGEMRWLVLPRLFTNVGSTTKVCLSVASFFFSGVRRYKS